MEESNFRNNSIELNKKIENLEDKIIKLIIQQI